MNTIPAFSKFLQEIMALEGFQDSNRQSPIPVILPINEAREISEAICSHSQENEDHFNSFLNMAQMNTNLGNSSASRSSIGHIPIASLIFPTGAYLQIHGNTNVEPSMDVFPTDDTFSHLCQNERRMKLLKDIRTITPILKNVNEENIHHHQQQQQDQKIIQELLLKKLQSCNPQTHLQQLISAPQLQKEQMRNLMQEHGNQQGTFAPLFDGALCSRRFKQYLYHLRNDKHDNDIAYWKKFVSEYYGPGSKKRWCFSTYENIESHAAGVFCPKSTEKWCCDLCGSRSGKGLEAPFDLFPRLFKIKLESGILDEILFLDLPRAYKISYGLVLEYGKAIQESVYEDFRVVHEGKLRIVFRHDLKMLSWEFCAWHHEEFLLRRLIAPQVNRLVQAAMIYQNDIQNAAPYRLLPENLRTVNNMFILAGNQLARKVEIPLVNALGYPKRFIRCLQIAEVVDSMKDLMAFSHHAKLGPIASLNVLSPTSKTSNQTKEKQQSKIYVDVQNVPTFPEQPFRGYHASGYQMTENGQLFGSRDSSSPFVNLDHQLHGHNSSVSSLRRNLSHQSTNSHLYNEVPNYQSSEHSKNPHQTLADKLLHGPQRKLNEKTRNKLINYGESSNAASAKVILANPSRLGNHGNVSATSQNMTIKAEPYSP